MTTELERKALLPAGLRDILPPRAEFEAALIERLVGCFARAGYQRVKPPLVEFEEGLLASAGVDLSRETFRLMDPVSQRMMGVRADITPQIGRIAQTRLRKEPRPLRLSYAGEVLRVRSTQLRPERQFAQVGAELIGSSSVHADAEIIRLATEALQRIGVKRQVVDLTIPPLVPAICAGLDLDDARRNALRRALDRKDIDAVGRLGGAAADVLCALLESPGPAAKCVAALDSLTLPPAAAQERSRVAEVVALLDPEMSSRELTLTLDPVENRGFEYHTGVSFTIFAPGERGELGGGGRYFARANGTGARREDTTDGAEPATGVTIYVDTLTRILPAPGRERRVLVPVETPRARIHELREEGWRTVGALGPLADPAAEARRMRCTHVLVGADVRPAE